jgi:hypothetical protein
MTQTRDIKTALETFRQHGGVMRTGLALTLGIHPAALYKLVHDGHITRLARLLRQCRGHGAVPGKRHLTTPSMNVVASVLARLRNEELRMT